MKKRILILLLAGMFCLAGCEQNTQNPPQDPAAQDEQDTDDKEDPQEDGKDEDEPKPVDDQKSGDASKEDEGEENKPAESVKIHVYSSNDDATAFQSTEAAITSLSPEAVLQALALQGAIAADVKINSLEQSTVDGISTLLIDFNGAFASYVSSMGSTGEYYAIGGVCNTFLDAYGCEQIKITVDGATLETGHTDYPGYMGMFS